MNFKVMDTKVLVRVNNVDIFSTSDEQLIPIRPICQALRVDVSRQLKKIKNDKILSTVLCRVPQIGRDGKTYSMCCIPTRYVLGWLFTINLLKVRGDAYENVFKSKKRLYDYFANRLFGRFENKKLPKETSFN